ncbi:MAG TPA: AI-2E family transporter [Thermoanaerobaculia bacterium]|nr:AI-2E family transporter [Thermoanaerobaculia bacterium]
MTSSPQDPAPGALRFRQAFLLLLVAAISLLFVAVIQQFLLALFLAAVLAGMAYPLYRWILRKVRGRRALASIATMLVLALGVALPLAGFLALVAAEAVQVSQGAGEWFQGQSGRLEELRGLAERLPFADRLIPDTGDLAEQFREIASRTGTALMGTVAAATRGTLSFFLQLFVLLYAMFFFLMDGPAILRKILYYMPLDAAEEEALLERFVSVTRATLKGSLLIGVIQGALGGLAFWLLGVPGSAFWGTVMVVLSVIPAVGAALVWVPAVGYLLLVDRMGAAIALLVWGALVVSTIDNFLRPRLVGRDARMSDLLILLSTLGGIFVFGAMGFIVGPIIAALFVAIWDIYGQTFRAWLPEVPARLGRAAPVAAAKETEEPAETT